LRRWRLIPILASEHYEASLPFFVFKASASTHPDLFRRRCNRTRKRAKQAVEENPISDSDADQVKERTVADDFKLAVNQAFPASVDAGAGAQATANVAVTPNYSGSVNVTCDTSAMPGAHCVLTPANPVAISANAAANPDDHPERTGYRRPNPT
jgi:hypothetical protein